jgi:hypothetical protein
MTTRKPKPQARSPQQSAVHLPHHELIHLIMTSVEVGREIESRQAWRGDRRKASQPVARIHEVERPERRTA